MKLKEVELRRIRLSLVSPFQTTFGTQTERDVLLVRVAGPDVEGWGECVALSGTGVFAGVCRRARWT